MSTTRTNHAQLGRPPSPKEKVRRNRIVTFLTDQQLIKLKQLAEHDGTSLSWACYDVLKEHLD